MAIQLEETTLDRETVRVRDTRAFEGGRMVRRVRIQGVLTEAADRNAVEALLDEQAAVLGAEGPWRSLILRPGRRLWIRPDRVEREVGLDGRTGAFDLLVESRYATEEGIEPTVQPWSIEGSEGELALNHDGTAAAPLAIAYAPSEETVRPGFTCGARSLIYDGVIQPGEIFELDDRTGQVTVDGTNVTPYCEGLPPRMDPGEGTVLFAADTGGSGTAEVSFHVRWW